MDFFPPLTQFYLAPSLTKNQTTLPGTKLFCSHGHPNPLAAAFLVLGVSFMWYKTQPAALGVRPGGAKSLFNPLEAGARQELPMEKGTGLFAALPRLAAVLLPAEGGRELRSFSFLRDSPPLSLPSPLPFGLVQR